ncbi:MAG: hypothetical protein WB867_03870 [Candidatus Dormiibacterota bacterium]
MSAVGLGESATERTWPVWLELPFGWHLRRPSREGYGLAAIVLIGFGCARSSGEYSPASLLVVVVGACLLMLTATGSGRPAATATWGAAVFLGALSTGLLFHSSTPIGWLAPILGGVGAVVAIVFSGTLVRVCGCVIAGLMSITVLIEHIRWGQAPIDVFDFTQRGSLQLLHGQDPYFGAYLTTTLHLPLAHYPFWPGVLLLSVPGRLLGDVRVSNLLAAAAVIAALTVLAKRHGGTGLAWRCLALSLTLPFWPFMIRQAWAEIFFIAAVALWLVLRDQHRAASVAVLGVGVATVATGLPLLVLPLLWFRRARIEILAALALALLIFVPFAVWVGPAHFVSYTVLTQLHLPPRADGLDLDSVWLSETGAWLPIWVWPAGSLLVLVLLAVTRPRNWSNAFYRGAAFLVVALLLAKWAFFNYYFLVTMGVIAAIALDDFRKLVPPVADASALPRVSYEAAVPIAGVAP